MFKKIFILIKNHINENKRSYVLLFLIYFGGIAAGAFFVNGIDELQKNELLDYFNGFISLFSDKQADSAELFKMSLLSNYKWVIILYVSGISIIGFPLSYFLMAGKGFLTGFTSGIIIGVSGIRGILYAAISMIPKDLFIIPCLIAIGVCTINYSLSQLKKPSPAQHSRWISMRESLAAYSIMVFIFSIMMLSGILAEAYITPALTKIFLPVLSK